MTYDEDFIPSAKKKKRSLSTFSPLSSIGLIIWIVNLYHLLYNLSFVPVRYLSCSDLYRTQINGIRQRLYSVSSSSRIMWLLLAPVNYTQSYL